MPDDHNGVPPGSVGTAPLDAPVSRAELERALRKAYLAIDTLREELIMLAGQVVATGAAAAVEAAVDEATPAAIQQIRINDEQGSSRITLGEPEDKYKASIAGPDCLALLPLCKGKCCTLHFSLSSQDLDEGVIRWDYGQPYQIRQRLDDNYCVHSDPERHCCTVYEHRPRPCRVYDCRKDQRIWVDFEQKIPATESPFARKEDPAKEAPDWPERVRLRQVTMAMEGFSITTHEAERMRQEKKGGG